MSGMHAAVPSGNETILLVEDEEEVRHLIVDVLEMQGYIVLSHSRVTDAIAAWEKHGETIQLLLTDVIMPQMSGPELAQHLRNLNPQLKVLFISGYANQDDVIRCILEQGAAYIQKPFTPSSLAKKIREVLDQ